MAGLLIGTAFLAGCSSSSSSSKASNPTLSPSRTSAVATTRPAAVATTAPAGTTATTAKPAGGVVQNLSVTDDVRAQLLAAGAAMNNLPASAYTGLAAGRTYYALDPATSTYWAGAALVPSASSLQAQVSVQDDGSYRLFTRPAAGTWTGYNVGFANLPGAKCPVTVPAAVLAVWGWPAGSCHPAG